jgi:hypothetical protein
MHHFILYAYNNTYIIILRTYFIIANIVLKKQINTLSYPKMILTLNEF